MTGDEALELLKEQWVQADQETWVVEEVEWPSGRVCVRKADECKLHWFNPYEVDNDYTTIDEHICNK